MTYGDSQKLKTRIDFLLEEASHVQDEKLQAELARYLCILTSSFIEAVVQDTLRAYTKKRSSGDVSNFVSSSLRRFTNPNMEKIVQICGAFKIEEDMVRRKIPDQMSLAIMSIASNRNQFAHGHNPGFSLYTFRKYYGQMPGFARAFQELFPLNKSLRKRAK